MKRSFTRSTRLLRWHDIIFFCYLKIVFDFVEPFHLPLKPFLRKSKSLLGLTHIFAMVINHSQPLKSRILYSLSNKHPPLWLTIPAIVRTNVARTYVNLVSVKYRFSPDKKIVHRSTSILNICSFEKIRSGSLLICFLIKVVFETEKVFLKENSIVTTSSRFFSERNELFKIT